MNSTNEVFINLRNNSQLRLFLTDYEIYIILLQYHTTIRNNGIGKSGVMLNQFITTNFNDSFEVIEK